MSCNECSKCERRCEQDCACPKPICEVVRKSPDSLVVRINDNGITTEFDCADIIYDGQTDTSLSVDLVKRVLKFVAERHIDSLSAQELGSILHLADLGDVATKGVQQGSMLVYQQNNNCPSGCVGTNNLWQAWNALDAGNATGSATYASVYDAEGNPMSLLQPDNPNQFYQLGWNGSNKLSYSQPPIRSSKLPGDYTLCMSANTKEIYATL